MAAVRKWLLAGLLVIVPVAITVAVLRWIIDTLDQTLLILPEAWQPDRLIGFHIPGFGVLLTLAILLIVGAVASNFVGRKLVGLSQRRTRHGVRQQFVGFVQFGKLDRAASLLVVRVITLREHAIDTIDRFRLSDVTDLKQLVIILDFTR